MGRESSASRADRESVRILNDDLVVVVHVLRVLIQLVNWFDGV